MKREDISDMLSRFQKRRAAMKAAHTPENEARLRTEVEAIGGKLIKRRRGEEGFALKLPMGGGSEIDGISLADVDALLKRIVGTR